MAGRVCRIHQTALLTVNGRGELYREPVCLSCLEPHRDGCAQAEYLDAQALWLRWQLERYPDSVQFPVPSDETFWSRFGAVPFCRCPGRPIDSVPVPADLSGVETAFTWKRLRRRLVKMLVVTTGTPAPRHWTLTVLSHAAGSTPDEAWSRLRIFETVGSRAGTRGRELV